MIIVDCTVNFFENNGTCKVVRVDHTSQKAGFLTWDHVKI